VGIEELVVVTGYCGAALATHLGRRRGGVAIRCLDNPDYATTNNIYSLWAARASIAAHGGGFMLLESDIVCDTSVLAPLVEPDRMTVSRYTADMDGTGVVVADDGGVAQMVLRAHETASSRLSSLHKTVNFYSFGEATWRDSYEPALRRWIQGGRVNDYYEAALAELINRGEVAMRAVDASDMRWAEIDDRDDLARAERRFC
jgi:choline kinase